VPGTFPALPCPKCCPFVAAVLLGCGTLPERHEMGVGMAAVSDDAIEALARTLVRQTILASGWYPSLPDKERQELIAQDMDQHWHLMVHEARKRLEQHGEASMSMS
jgi:hypothetical protein